MKTFFLKLGCISLILLAILSCDDNLVEEENFINKRPEDWGGIAPSNPFWDWVDAFPGPISHKIPRLGNNDSVIFYVKGDYKPLIWCHINYGDTLKAPCPWFGPGLWATIMEPITIDVPAGVNNLNCLIGSWTSPLHTRTPVKERWGDVQDTIPLHPGRNIISSFFGGMMYFCWEQDTEPVKPGTTVVIKGGCVRANNYIKGVTDYDEWIKSIRELYVKDTIGVDDNGNIIVQESRKPAVEWVELEGDHIIMTVKYDDFKNCANPATLLDIWDKYVLANLDFYGYPYEVGQPKRRLVLDIQLNAQWSILGYYPFCLRRYRNLQYNIWDYDVMSCQKDLGRNGGPIFTLMEKEMRSGMFASGLFGQDYSNKIFCYYYAQRMFNTQPSTNHIDGPFLMSEENPRRHLPMRLQDQPTRMLPFLQLVYEYGWSLMPYVSHASRLTKYRPHNWDICGVDRFAMHAAEYCNANLCEFFQFWHWEISSFAANYLKTFPAPKRKFWLTYRDQIGDWKKPVPQINSPLNNITPHLQQSGPNTRRNWGVKAGFANEKARNILDNNENTYMMAKNVQQKDAWIQIDLKDTLHFNFFYWGNPFFHDVNPYSIKIKYGFFKDAKKKEVDWKYIANQDGSPQIIKLNSWTRARNSVYLSDTYSAEVIRLEIVNIGGRDRLPKPWPSNVACAIFRLGRYEIGGPGLNAPYPYIPPNRN